MNKKLLRSVSTAFRKWIHADSSTKDTKLRLVRTLVSADNSEATMLAEARAHVGGALVEYAKGNPDVKTVKPYGLKAARSTAEFKHLPSTLLSLTFAALYQALRTDPDMLGKWIKTPRHNITNPWPRGMMLRFLKLQKVFTANRENVFTAYEAAGGDYMADSDETSVTPESDKTKGAQEFEEDFD